jgi:terminal uridylyltransferase
MMDVKLRPTARIPIVQFMDKASGVRCDMSFGNSLAITNTLLLRTYSEIDPRIRPLAYIIKHWVQSRHINSPADGTLSSYGYVICLLYFLQTRPVPLVPNLQKLPPTWTGQSLSNDQMHSDRESDGSRSDSSVNATYFYKPENNPIKTALLSKFAAKNKESIGELLAAFFNFYAWQFDYNSDVVSIQSGKEKNVSKIQKAESDGWPQHERLRYFISVPFSYSFFILNLSFIYISSYPVYF